MKIALIDTLDKGFRDAAPNVAIASLAGCLAEKGHEVGVLDLYFSDAERQQQFLQDRWDLVGITATSFAYNVALEVARTIKGINPSPPPVVLGGAHVSVAREEVLEEPAFDFAIYGEGEIPLLALLDLLQKDGAFSVESLNSIPGLIFRSDRGVQVTPPPSRIRDLDSQPLPPYHLFPMDSYTVHPLSTSRGCPYSCIYCASDAILGKKWVARSPSRMIEEVEYLVSNWGKKPFSIVDDSFNLDVARVKEFCRLLIQKELDIVWTICGGMRADRIDLEMLSLMKQAGCLHIGIGVESANPGVLKNIGKGETIEEIRAGIHMVKKAGLPVSASFMIGNPGDTLATIRESIDFIKAERLDDARFFIAIPYPSTKLWQYVDQNGTFLRKDYVNYHDFSDEPSFETADFSYQDRIVAYRMANEEMSKLRKRVSVKKIANLMGSFASYSRSNGLAAALEKTVNFISKKPAGSEASRDEITVSANGFVKIETRYSRQG